MQIKLVNNKKKSLVNEKINKRKQKLKIKNGKHQNTAVD